MSANESMALITVDLGDKPATLESVAQALTLETSDFDQSFGVVTIDAGRVAVRVRADKVGPTPPAGASGPFSDPRIEPFGPPR